FLIALWKLYMNCVFGKTMQNPRKYTQVEVVTSKKILEKLLANPLVSGFQPLEENLSLVQMRPKSIKLKYPIAVGQTILDLSNMFIVHVQVMVRPYGPKLS